MNTEQQERCHRALDRILDWFERRRAGDAALLIRESAAAPAKRRPAKKEPVKGGISPSERSRRAWIKRRAGLQRARDLIDGASEAARKGWLKRRRGVSTSETLHESITGSGEYGGSSLSRLSQPELVRLAAKYRLDPKPYLSQKSGPGGARTGRNKLERAIMHVSSSKTVLPKQLARDG